MSQQQRVILSKFALLTVALLAAMVASLKPAVILPLVSASFSLAASALLPAMVLGIFWRGTTRAGAVAGMLAGFGVTVYYMTAKSAGVRSALGFAGEPSLWFGIQPVAAGVFGMAVGISVMVAASLLGRARPAATVATTGNP